MEIYDRTGLPTLAEFFELVWDFMTSTKFRIYATDYYVSCAEIFLIFSLSFILLYFVFNFFSD